MRRQSCSGHSTRSLKRCAFGVAGLTAAPHTSVAVWVPVRGGCQSVESAGIFLAGTGRWEPLLVRQANTAGCLHQQITGRGAPDPHSICQQPAHQYRQADSHSSSVFVSEGASACSSCTCSGAVRALHEGGQGERWQGGKHGLRREALKHEQWQSKQEHWQSCQGVRTWLRCVCPSGCLLSQV